MMHWLMDFCVRRPKAVAWVMAGTALALGLLAALPTVAPGAFPMLHGAKIDTDPENMLATDEPVRVFHDEMKKEFALYDMLVVGVVNGKAPDYVFNPATLRDVHELTAYAQTLRGEAAGKKDDPQAGVIGIDIIAPSTVDNIEQAGLGTVSFEWLMAEPPATAEAARAVREKAMRLPFMKGTLVSEDGQALALYLPIATIPAANAATTVPVPFFMTKPFLLSAVSHACRLLDRAHQRVLALQAHERLHVLAVLEQDQRRDTAHAEPRRRSRVFVDIDLRDHSLRPDCRGHILKDRPLHPARPAPRRPEIHQHHAAAGRLVEITVVEFSHMCTHVLLSFRLSHASAYGHIASPPSSTRTSV